MSRLNEKEIIKAFQAKFGNSDHRPEDVENFTLGKTKVIFNIDTLVESTDVPPGLGAYRAARKSVVASASDFAAKGIRPRFGFVSVVVPESYSKEDVMLLASGLSDAAGEMGFKILGGDTNKGVELALSVCLVGEAESIVGRGGAKVGDIVFVTGPFGYPAAGLEIVKRGINAGRAFACKARDAVFSPLCRMDFGVAAREVMTSSMDSSDGLSSTLNEMARQSGLKFVIDSIPAEKEIFDFAEANKIEASRLIFDGGEEFELVFTARPVSSERILGIGKKTRVPVMPIGRVMAGSGVTLNDGNGLCKIKDAGWDHFRT